MAQLVYKYVLSHVLVAYVAVICIWPELGRAETTPSFTGLGEYTRPRALSGNGKVAVGRVTSSSKAFTWTGGALLILPYDSGDVYGVSYDGDVIGGRFDGIYGNQCCGPLGGAFFDGREISHVSGYDKSVTTGVSGDGRFAVGVREPANAVAFRYDPNDGPYILVPGHYLFDAVSTSAIYGEPSDISHDGSAVVGTGCIGGATPCGGWRWTDGIGAEYIPFTPLGISPDGHTIVGSSSSLGAVVWTEATGLVTIPGTQPGSTAEAVSDNGVVVGTDSLGAYIWDVDNGRRELSNVLATLGIDINGFTLTEAIDISADGQTIVGRGRNGAGTPEGWIATLPEPSTLLLLAGGGLGLMRRVVRP